ncbi:hypothetical protein D5274_12210 [bacterium 1XD42-94]|nr:hypothetical protein [bacterium 1XD42-76]NBK05889.1 hypothetical protein [bacterium 1XD42-94]
MNLLFCSSPVLIPICIQNAACERQLLICSMTCLDPYAGPVKNLYIREDFIGEKRQRLSFMEDTGK